MVRGVQAVAGDAGAERGHSNGVEDSKFWSQCLVFVVSNHGVGASRQNSLTTLKFHSCLAVSDFMSREVWSGHAKFYLMHSSLQNVI